MKSQLNYQSFDSMLRTFAKLSGCSADVATGA